MVAAKFNTVNGKKRDQYEVARRRMLTEQLIPGGVKDERVLDAMALVPRHEFVSSGMQNQAYLDRPLHIGMGQTISQPLMVAIMTEALLLKGHERVLEIGTGSGYQAAVLSFLAKEIFTIERIADLSIRARKILYRLQYNNIKLKIGDGTLGWKEEAPFDAIIVTAGSPAVPDELVKQLKDGGVLVIPVGGEEMQYLELIRRTGNAVKRETKTACRFVKLVGEKGWNDE